MADEHRCISLDLFSPPIYFRSIYFGLLLQVICIHSGIIYPFIMSSYDINAKDQLPKINKLKLPQFHNRKVPTATTSISKYNPSNNISLYNTFACNSHENFRVHNSYSNSTVKALKRKDSIQFFRSYQFQQPTFTTDAESSVSSCSLSQRPTITKTHQTSIYPSNYDSQ